ncbi:terminase small subunit [Leuconostoc falkenbergense]|uniref:terminase small subunit n=1 Tax=Leuconostoc falkenbergense TaxID=2766470 RepID=UPI0021AA5620|nr:terminase small subunit [Leuconostoc falkenbergense]MCT4410259.1 terminase small subunit [Leuconostoc falkenbergense]
MKLTPKQKKFADEYIKTGNAMQSAITAGYSKEYAKARSSKMSENVGIKSYIEKRMEQIASPNILTAEQILERLTGIVIGEITETVVVATPIGVEKTEKTADFKTQISAMRDIMKRYPNNDKLIEQQIRKLSAEADIAEANAREVTDNGTANEIRVIGFDRRAEEDERS